MSKLFSIVLIISIIILFWFVFYSYEEMKIGMPGGFYKMFPEGMVNEMDWENMSRGLNVNMKEHSAGSTIKMLNEMEKSNSGDISVFD